MYRPLIAVLLACSCTPAPNAMPVARPRAPDATPAPAVAPPPAPPPVVLPHLTLQGIGDLTGDTPFDLAAVQHALPELAWAPVGPPENLHIVGSLDGTPIVFLGGYRFVETIRVASPRIVSELGIVIGQPSVTLVYMVQLPSCMAGSGPLQSARSVDMECWADQFSVLLDGDPESRVRDAPDLLDGRKVIGLGLRVEPGPRMKATLAERPPRLPLDPVVASSPLVIDRTGIHPVTDLRSITLDTLSRALPHLEVTAGTNRFLVSHNGAHVLEITLSAGKPVRVEALHPSIRTRLGIAVDQAARDGKEIGSQLDLVCSSDAAQLAATCALSNWPRIELKVAAAVRLPPEFGGLGMYDDPWVTSIVWTAPRAPASWPTIDNDRVGNLTPEIARSREWTPARTALADFDLVGPGQADWVWLDGFVGSKKVFSFVEGGITLLDPRFRLAGIGVGSTIRDAQAAGLTLVECYAADLPDRQVPDPQDWCSVRELPRVTLQLGRGRIHERPMELAELGNRRITGILWRADPQH